MKIRKGVAAIIFREKKGRNEFLITHRVLRWKGWETLKGGSLAGEKPHETLMRELKEELSVPPKVARVLRTIPSAKIFFRIPSRFRQQMGGFSHALYEPFYLVKLPQSARVSLRKDTLMEHDRFRWVSSEEALKKLTYSNVRIALRAALRMIG